MPPLSAVGISGLQAGEDINSLTSPLLAAQPATPLKYGEKPLMAHAQAGARLQFETLLNTCPHALFRHFSTQQTQDLYTPVSIDRCCSLLRRRLRRYAGASVQR